MSFTRGWLTGSTSPIQEDSPEQRVSGVSSLQAAETQGIAATLGWSDDRRERFIRGRWKLQHSRGAGLRQPRGRQSKKLDDSTMLAPPTFPVSSEPLARLPKTSGPGKRSDVRKRGERGEDFAWGIAIHVCVRTGNIYDNQHPGWHRWASWRFTVSIQRPPSPSIARLIESSDLLKRMGNVGLISLAARRGPLSDVCVPGGGGVHGSRGNGYHLWTTAIRGGGGKREVDKKRGRTGSERLVSHGISGFL